MAAFAYLPISTPALKLSVAKRASVASCGSVGVSSATTITPAARAFLMLGTIALVALGVIRIAFAPAVIMFSMAVTWLALSPSNLPAAVSSLAPSFDAAASAPCFIFTKNGLVSVLVMRPTTGWSAAWLALAHHTADAATHIDTIFLATGCLREFRFMGRSSGYWQRRELRVIARANAARLRSVRNLDWNLMRFRGCPESHHLNHFG